MEILIYHLTHHSALAEDNTMSYDWTTAAGGPTISMCQEMKGDEASGYLLVGGCRYNQAFTVQMERMDPSLTCPTFLFLILYGANYSSWIFSSLLYPRQSCLFILSFFLCLFFYLHYVDQWYCHVTLGLCYITLLSSFVAWPTVIFITLYAWTRAAFELSKAVLLYQSDMTTTPLKIYI